MGVEDHIDDPVVIYKRLKLNTDIGLVDERDVTNIITENENQRLSLQQ